MRDITLAACWQQHDTLWRLTIGPEYLQVLQNNRMCCTIEDRDRGEAEAVSLVIGLTRVYGSTLPD